MNTIVRISCILAMAAMGVAAQRTFVAAPRDFIIAADISGVQVAEARGVKFSDKGVTKDILAILKDHGFNYVRLRVFVDPTRATSRDLPYSMQGYCDLPHTIEMAKRVKAMGMGLLIDFHYSDSWADPGKQFTPDMVQVGNEITPGLMTDRGGSARDWTMLGRLLKAGIARVKEVDPKILVMLHIDKGGDNMATRRWVDAALTQGVQFDILGESCYTRWQGPPSEWKTNFDDLVMRYPNLSFVIAEVGSETKESFEIMRSLPKRKGLGTFIWEPTSNGNGQALFDTTGAVIPEKMAAYDNK